MKKLNLILISIIFLFANCKKKKSYQKLKTEKVTFSQIIKPNININEFDSIDNHYIYFNSTDQLLEFLYNDSLKKSKEYKIPLFFYGFSDSNSNEMIKINLTEDSTIKFFTYKLLNVDYKNFNKEYILVNENKYGLHQIIKKTKIIKSELKPYLCFHYSYYFDDLDLIFFELYNRYLYIKCEFKSILIYNQKDKNFIFIYNSYYNNKIFCDFNNDKILDYIELNNYSDTLRVFNYINNKMCIDKKHFIIIKKNKPKSENETILNNNLPFKLDLKKTKWYKKF